MCDRGGRKKFDLTLFLSVFVSCIETSTLFQLSGYGQFMLSTSFLPLHGCITATDSVLQKMLEVETKAPDFELPDQNGELHKLSEYLGKKVKKKNYGKVSMGVVRTTYFIDEHGIIVKANDKVKAADDPEKMLQELSR